MAKIDPELMASLAKPSFSLPRFGKVQNIRDEQETAYSPTAITHKMQNTILRYIEDPERVEYAVKGQPTRSMTRWLVVLKGRQGGCSMTCSAGFYVKAQYTPGWQHITAADTRERAKYLFSRVSYMDKRWPEELKVNKPESQRRLYEWEHSGSMLVESGGSDGMGIGMSASSWHLSEIPLWPDAEGRWGQLFPAIQNRENAMLIMESTPFEMSYPSAEFFRDICDTARKGRGRWLFAFFPYWDSLLNARPWQEDDKLTTEEQRLMDRYGKFGLTLDNLAFRRDAMDNNPILRRKPELFSVWYPFDDLTCWLSSSNAVIPERFIRRHMDDLVEWDEYGDYKQYSNPKKDAVYVIGVDAAGYGTRDHAAFQVFEVWAGVWKQVATFASLADPHEVADKLYRVGRQFNWAMINVERNGVGVGILAVLDDRGYPNLYYEKPGIPGQHKCSEDQLLGPLLDALDESFVLRDRDLIRQLQTYRRDKSLARTTEAQILHGHRSRGRRERHHWDKVSALMMVPRVALMAPQRVQPTVMTNQPFVFDVTKMTLRERERYEREVREMSRVKTPGRRRAVYRRQTWRPNARPR